MMIGVDYPPSFQVIAFLMEEAGEYSERRLNHSDGRSSGSIETCSCEESVCAWGCRRPGIPAGSSEYWQSWVSLRRLNFVKFVRLPNSLGFIRVAERLAVGTTVVCVSAVCQSRAGRWHSYRLRAVKRI
jgi:hypothetical protein